jgi:Leucine-rich repeat (LRR) protein
MSDRCPGLQSLALNSNYLAVLPVSMKNLASLTKLSLANNRFECLAPELVKTWAAFLPSELVARAEDLWKLFAPVSSEGESTEIVHTEVIEAPKNTGRLEVSLDGCPILRHISEDGVEEARGVTRLTEPQYSEPLIYELRKKAKVER